MDHRDAMNTEKTKHWLADSWSLNGDCLEGMQTCVFLRVHRVSVVISQFPTASLRLRCPAKSSIVSGRSRRETEGEFARNSFLSTYNRIPPSAQSLLFVPTHNPESVFENSGERRVWARGLQDWAEKPGVCRPGALTGASFQTRSDHYSPMTLPSRLTLRFAFTLATQLSTAADYEPRVFKNSSGATLPYRLLVPPTVAPDQKHPLVLFLHGAAGGDVGQVQPHWAAPGNVALETTGRLCYQTAMKMTFAIPDDVGQRFREAVPDGERSAVVTDFLRKKLRLTDASLEAVCRRVNKLKALEQDMAGWERFDDQEA